MAPTDGTATAPLPPLPDDVLMEILHRLPAKSVLQFRAVSKPWRRLLSDPAFIRDHHRRAPLALLLNDTLADNGGAIAALPCPYTDQSTAAPLHRGFASRNTYLEGCCDGLLLLSFSHRWAEELDANGNEHRYFVCNPATQQLAGLPTDLGQVVFVGFYRHAPTAEYRVLCRNCHSSIRNPNQHQIYEYLVAAPGQDTARLLGPSNLWTDTDWPLVHQPATHRGCLHWLMWRPSMGVVAFDTTSEEFRLMRGPVDGDARMDVSFGRLVGVDGTVGASVFADHEGTLNLWVLESYEEEAWALRYSINIGFLEPDRSALCSISLVHVSDEGDAVLMTFGRKRVGVYNLRRGEVVSAMPEPFHGHLRGTGHVYQESLLSPAPKKASVIQLNHRDGNLVEHG